MPKRLTYILTKDLPKQWAQLPTHKLHLVDKQGRVWLITADQLDEQSISGIDGKGRRLTFELGQLQEIWYDIPAS
ncbi:hypothetical protein FHS56_000785 [Thermonema lapsum]|jgi:hypothetical protein|uniref:Uncharacterized protein n=1 Tax=Thermonema lapsum TaxID=28195 RepID=A0A846MPA4_9BACT|nr:hypothetical protein [Thermonema lapsum]NIK73299.1 hypothetical protein [Thermonema lapsum]